jgi:hypothetical protein
VPAEVVFRPDLYRGVASHCDRFRLGYPDAMIDDLASRADLTGRGRLLDLAGGTGQIILAMQHRFAEYWAVDQEPDMVELVRRRATAPGMPAVTTMACRAEACSLAAVSFEMVAVGNAFHRLGSAHRGGEGVRVASAGWVSGVAVVNVSLDQNRRLADGHGGDHGRLVDEDEGAPWGSRRVGGGPGPAPGRGSPAAGGIRGRGIVRLPDPAHMGGGRVIGLVYSTSFLPPAVLADRAPAFEEDLRGRLGVVHPDQRFSESIDFGYQPARRPGGRAS